jgi:CheY-like chemotaxis protein
MAEDDVTWLLVEDDPDIRNVVAVMMQLWGEKPLALSDGNAAWSWLDGVIAGTYKGDLPDLALMDIRMPGHTGDQIAARIRVTERLKNIPIILMTAFTLSETEVQNMVERAGIDHLVKKPLPDMDDFRTTLYRVRDERRKRSATSVAVPTVSSPSAPPKPVITLPAATTITKVPPLPAAPTARPATNPASAPTVPTVKLNAQPESSKPPTPTIPLTPANGKPPEPSTPPNPPKPRP